jgi:hypothetical protein
MEKSVKLCMYIDNMMYEVLAYEKILIFFSMEFFISFSFHLKMIDSNERDFL